MKYIRGTIHEKFAWEAVFVVKNSDFRVENVTASKNQTLVWNWIYRNLQNSKLFLIVRIVYNGLYNYTYS